MGRDAGLRYLAVRGLTGLLTATGAGFAVNAWMLTAERERLCRRVVDTPARSTAIVPGARVYTDGSPSPVLEDRLATARDLLLAGKVERVLVSGDGRSPEGDESAVMRAWLVGHDVSAARVVTDPGGTRTRATMERARESGVVDAVICTQAFHLARSVFLATRAGIDAVGLVADRRVYARRRKDRAREFFARQVALLESWLPPAS